MPMKIIPGQPILQLHVERNSPYDDQPSSAKRIRKENIHPKKSNKKKKHIKSSLLMTMSGYLQTVVKFGMITEIADG